MKNYLKDFIVLLIVIAGMGVGAVLPGEFTFRLCTIAVWSLMGLWIAYRLEEQLDASTRVRYAMMFGVLGAFMAPAANPIISGGNWLDGYPFFIILMAGLFGFWLGRRLKEKYPPETFKKIAFAAGVFSIGIVCILYFI